MGKGDDLLRRRAQEKVESAMRQARGESQQDTSEKPLSEEFVADARMRRRALELAAELEQARADEALYEERYGMTFDEFQASFDPRADDDVSEEYLAWSRAAERVRMLRHELERLADRRTRRSRRKTPPQQADENSRRRGPIA